MLSILIPEVLEVLEIHSIIIRLCIYGAGIIIALTLVVWGIKSGNQQKERVNGIDLEEYADTKILEKKSERLLELPDKLLELRECDAEILNSRKYIFVSPEKFVGIQNQLRKITQLRAMDSYENLSEQTIRSTTMKAIKKLKLRVDDNLVVFMIKVAGVLDKNKIGISNIREKDSRYKSLNEYTAFIETEELRNAVRLFKWFSLGMNSMLLLGEYAPPNAQEKYLSAIDKTPTELLAEREDVLDTIQQWVNQYIRKEFHLKVK